MRPHTQELTDQHRVLTVLTTITNLFGDNLNEELIERLDVILNEDDIEFYTVNILMHPATVIDLELKTLTVQLDIRDLVKEEPSALELLDYLNVQTYELIKQHLRRH